jgi:hypothetical protein
MSKMKDEYVKGIEDLGSYKNTSRTEARVLFQKGDRPLSAVSAHV